MLCIDGWVNFIHHVHVHIHIPHQNPPLKWTNQLPHLSASGDADRLRRSLAIDSNLVKPRVARSQRRVRHIFMEELYSHVPIFTRTVGTGKVVVLFFWKEEYIYII